MAIVVALLMAATVCVCLWGGWLTIGQLVAGVALDVLRATWDRRKHPVQHAESPEEADI